MPIRKPYDPAKLTALISTTADHILGFIEDVDLTSSGAATTTLYTIPAGKVALVSGCYVILKSVAVFTSVPSLGLRASVTGDIYADQSATGLDSANEFFRFPAGGISSLALAAGTISLGRNTAAVATTYSADICLTGLLVDA